MRSRQSPSDPLDLVPIMNLVTILIPFLLMSAQFVSLAAIDTTLPALGEDLVELEGDDEEEPLGLAINIGARGYTLTTSRAVSLPVEQLPCPSDCSRGYDTAGLTDALDGLKARFPDEQVVVLVPDREVSYEVLVTTMDAAREDEAGRDLFPSVIIAGGLGR